MVVHPINVNQAHPHYGDSSWLKQLNLDFYGPAAERGRNLGITIALENLFTFAPDGRIVESYISSAEELSDLVDSIEGTVACLDVGHSLVTGRKPEDMARILGNRLKVLHIQSNDGRIDLHMPPYMHSHLDWDALAISLHDIGYNGWVNLETFGFTANLPNELLPSAIAYQYACASLFQARIEKG